MTSTNPSARQAITVREQTSPIMHDNAHTFVHSVRPVVVIFASNVPVAEDVLRQLPIVPRVYGTISLRRAVATDTHRCFLSFGSDVSMFCEQDNCR